MREDRRIWNTRNSSANSVIGFSSFKDESTMGQLWLATWDRVSLSSGISGTFGYFQM